MAKNLFNLDTISGYDFEDLIARIMKKLGYHDIKITPKSGDKGKDIIMKFDDGKKNYPVVVECKHQNFVGRPVIQKLQGAMLHEMKNESFIKGIVVTSGSFSPTVGEYVKEINKDHSSMQIELIDGKKLKNLCEKYDIIILNGKIQIITNNAIDFIEGEEVKNQIFKEFHQIIGNKDKMLQYKTKTIFHPSYYIRYNINSEFYTSVGCINTIQKKNEEIFLDGAKSGKLRKGLKNHFFDNGFPRIIQIKRDKHKEIIPFEFTEKEIEDVAFEKIIEENSENVNYYGRNNVKYTKTCKPSSRDIELKETKAVYLPKIVNEIKVKKQNYLQEVFSNKNDLFYDKDELSECKICGKHSTLFNNNLYFCKKCGRILCSNHKRLDAFDNTPVCLRCALKRKLILQTKYFISKINKEKYNKKYGEMNFLRKFYEDKITFLGAISLFMLIILGILVFN